MNFRRRQTRERSERWEREDAAPRLGSLIPNLKALKLELRETREDREVPGTTSVRHVIVARAGARFEFRCSGCEDGAYDVTSQVLSGLERQEPTFEGACNCTGTTGDRYCDRVLEFVAHAEYS